VKLRPVVLLALVGCEGGSISLDGSRQTCPAAAVDAVALDWFSTLLEEEQILAVTVTNDCLAEAGELTVSIALEGAGFSASAQGVTLEPGRSAGLEITWFATSYNPGSGTLTLNTNDPEVPQVVIPLTATVDPDQDGDGFVAVQAGGDDCDDRNGEINPAWPDVWYDGIDSDCDGADDFDQDRDGYRQGVDCDDLSAATFPGAAETLDLRDEDCDGLVDEDFLRPGDILVTEVMADPVAVFDTTGEWFEVTNTTDREINLVNWQVTDFAGGGFTVTGDLVLSPKGTAVFGTSASLRDNGGAAVDFTYPRAEFELANDGDAVGLRAGENTVTLLEYDLRWPIKAGASLSLDPLFVRRDTGTVSQYWCPSTTVMSGGDRGTPRAENDWCTTVDHDGDGITPAAGDCDDRDKGVYPGAPDRWNRVDDDCNGVVDDAVIGDVEDGWAEGDRRDYLSYAAGISVGDLDGDGALEAFIGSTRAGGGYDGVVYVLDASSADTWRDYAYNLDEARVTHSTAYDTLGATGIEQGDVTGDGKADLVLGASGYAGSSPVAVVYGDASKLKGTVDEKSATVIYTGSSFALDANRLSSWSDLDGDGAAEILVSDIYANGLGSGSTYAGAVRVLDAVGAKGSVSVTSAAVRTWYGVDYYDLYGSSIETADVNADGYGDTFACAPFADRSGAAYVGGCYLIYGAKDLPATGSVAGLAKFTVRGRAIYDRLGSATRMVLEDFDGDGKVDLGLPNLFKEEVLVYFDVATAGTDLDSSDADVTIRPRRAPTNLGRGITSGDFDGDGLQDLVVSAPDTASYTGAGADEVGQAWLFTGATLAAASSTLDEDDASASVRGAGTLDAFGWVVFAHDLDGDGADDLMFGAPGASSGAGRVSVMFGSP